MIGNRGFQNLRFARNANAILKKNIRSEADRRSKRKWLILGVSFGKLKSQVTASMAGSKKAISKIAPQTRIDNITKVTFEDKDGKTFVLHDARVWKINFAGNLAYQVRGDILIDLEEYFK
jgi:hypothetical protein